MKSAIALLLSASACSAFVPASVSRSSTKINSVFDDYEGAVDFRGKEMKFDPLKFSESYSPFVGWFRECEIRHGRTAMLAVMGFIATDFFRLPGEMYSFEAIPKTIDAHDALLKSGPMYQLVLWIGLWDLIITAPAVQAIGEGEREPGDYAWYWFAPEDEATMAKKKRAELLNGRLAMIAVGGIATQSIVTGHGFPYV
uniref:Plastid light harvesting protein n=1 Tax=Leptocylindrus danicus TaxID=163516 RepID=A0A7S2LMW8_9STRA|mmetsp:Transcript_7191/g.10741  ORF Transcript_7191/g.10741 Transcript_7191/m.10741 type:complete len:198 (+) Transcript_7191:31-624(+)|eukprot:CAMPEP_0116027330 /NCGR_PEP_ID=MMETSP0321-20121206/14563_1 /TAXON_ID=163516 /ORGANISM="Leptocylindrus danicus var. danicus, Strain B650" /LENGTH=197 /DNA_ID=CAMNT_0003500661 /DNA_START=20 /DNA_END=613 /DNA_ORIENTATION=-